MKFNISQWSHKRVSDDAEVSAKKGACLEVQGKQDQTVPQKLLKRCSCCSCQFPLKA